MIDMADFFPKALAFDTTFCNRNKLRERMISHFKQVDHLVLVSPRRYGKTSVILQAITDSKLPFAQVDFFLLIDKTQLIERFLEGVASLLDQLLPINEKALVMLRKFFKNFGVSLSIASIKVGIKLETTEQSVEKIVLDALHGLSEVLAKQKKTAVFFIDEVQDMANLSQCSQMEYALRSFAQQSRNIAFVFSGSNRKLLQSIFDDRNRPLWKLCTRINLARIEACHYFKFINAASWQQWKTKLADEVIEIILSLTECHPYYVNYLCSELWRAEVSPTVEAVSVAWQEMVKMELSSLSILFAEMKDKQRRILRYIAQQERWSQVTSVQSITDLKMTGRGITQSLKGLLEKDFVEELREGKVKQYRILDPLMRQVLQDA